MTLIDTAGIRITDDCIEQLGIMRSYEVADAADLVLIVLSAGEKQSIQEQAMYQTLYERYKNKCMFVISKSDLGSYEHFIEKIVPLSVSVYQEDSVSKLELQIEKTCKQLFSSAAPFLVSARQFNLLQSIKNIVKRMEQVMKTKSYELVSADAVAAISILNEITGKTVQEKSMDEVFRHFCVGK